MTLRLKFLLWKNINFWFKKTPFRYVFSIAIMYYCETMIKGACIKKMVAVKLQYKHYNGKKNKQGEGGGLKDTEFGVNTIRTLWVALLALPTSNT